MTALSLGNPGDRVFCFPRRQIPIEKGLRCHVLYPSFPIRPRFRDCCRRLALIRPPQARPRPSSRLRLGLERLEDRTVLSSFNLAVTSLADTGPGTLRCSAITHADAGSAQHTYNIEIKVPGTITLESAFPTSSQSMNFGGPMAPELP